MKHTLIIAEAGVNHNGSLVLAKQLIDAAAEAGVDYVKFQTSRRIISLLEQHEKRIISNVILVLVAIHNMRCLKDWNFLLNNIFELIAHCHQRGVKFFSTAFDSCSVDFLASLHLGLWKIPSGEITNYPYLVRIASFHEPVILRQV